MFMTRLQGMQTVVLPLGPPLRICLTPGPARYAVRAKICSRVSEPLTYPGKDSSNGKLRLGGR
jgi:hypothetical protein